MHSLLLLGVYNDCGNTHQDGWQDPSGRHRHSCRAVPTQPQIKQHIGQVRDIYRPCSYYCLHQGALATYVSFDIDKKWSFLQVSSSRLHVKQCAVATP